MPPLRIAGTGPCFRLRLHTVWRVETRKSVESGVLRVELRGKFSFGHPFGGGFRRGGQHSFDFFHDKINGGIRLAAPFLQQLGNVGEKLAFVRQFIFCHKHPHFNRKGRQGFAKGAKKSLFLMPRPVANMFISPINSLCVLCETLASLAVKLQSIRHTSYPIFQQDGVEIHQQPQLASA